MTYDKYKYNKQRKIWNKIDKTRHNYGQNNNEEAVIDNRLNNNRYKHTIGHNDDNKNRQAQFTYNRFFDRVGRTFANAGENFAAPPQNFPFLKLHLSHKKYKCSQE